MSRKQFCMNVFKNCCQVNVIIFVLVLHVGGLSKKAGRLRPFSKWSIQSSSISKSQKTCWTPMDQSRCCYGVHLSHTCEINTFRYKIEVPFMRWMTGGSWKKAIAWDAHADSISATQPWYMYSLFPLSNSGYWSISETVLSADGFFLQGSLKPVSFAITFCS